MPFVKTKFRLPSVTRGDGTLGAYVQANPVVSGQRFIWPAERIAIWQKQQAAAAAQRKGLPVQTSAAPSLQGVPARRAQRRLGDTPAPTVSTAPIGPALPPDMVAAGQMDPQTVWQNGIAALLAQKGAAGKGPNAPPAQQSNAVSYGLVIGGVAVAGGILIALVKGMGRKVGKPIPGAHVYEAL